MLINTQTPEELRLAIVTDSTLDTYQVEVAEGGLTRGNIYRGVISNIQPSLNAAFIDYGAERNGFLAIQDVVEDAWYKKPKKKGGRPKIEEVLVKGKPIVVQISREPEGQKGAALTTNLSLAGRYLVLTPFEDTRGVSRKVEDDEDRKRLKQVAGQLKVPKGCGVIVRTNALEQTKATLSRDLAALLRIWKQVGEEARKGTSTRLLYSDQDLVLLALRDYLDSSIAEVLVDSDDAYEKAQEYMRAFMPRGKTKLVRYKERTPLFSKFNLEPQIDRIYERRVELSSGGSIVIDRTEALTSIDVNSGRSTKGASQEETAVSTNVEAAKEVARQLRLRDIGGLLVVDFIDMRSPKSRRRIEKTLRDAMKDDKARVRVGRISANGLLEINRQRIHQALSLRTHRPCPTCDGTGRIASAEMVGLSLLRRIEARAATGTLQKVRIALHPELADAFQNVRRREIADLEREFDIKVEVIAAGHLHRPEQEVDWFSRPRSSQRPGALAEPEPTARVSDVTLKAPAQRPAEESPREERRKASDQGKKTTRSRRKKRSSEGSPSEETGGGRRRSRRRSARKTDETGAASETRPSPASSASNTPENKAHETKPQENDKVQESTAPRDEPQKPARRRRSRKPKGSSEERTETRDQRPQSQPASSEASESSGADATSGRRRRRRRTGPRKPATESHEERKPRAPKEPSEPKGSKGSKSSEGSNEPSDSGSAGRRRPRRRSRRQTEDAPAET